MNPPRLSGGRCRCSACGLYFTGTREFDRHRTGPYAKQGEWHGKRRCLSLLELQERGWRMNDRGFWMQSRPEAAPAGHVGPSEPVPARVGGAA
jgi:hypothetical protein